MDNQKNLLDETQSSPDRNWHTIQGKPGVLFRRHAYRKNGKKPDLFLAIRYRNHGKRITETLGWTSEGWTAEIAFELINMFRKNIRLGERPQSLKEKREMEAEARRREEAINETAKAGNITFGDLADYYLKWVQKNRQDSTTIEGHLTHHILPLLGSKPASAITQTDIQNLKETVAAQKPRTGRNKNNKEATLSPQTVLHILKTVREVYNYARETPIPKSPDMMLFSGLNPVLLSTRGHRGIRIAKFDSRRLRILNDEEINTILSHNAAKGTAREVHDMILFSLDTGIRIGELVHLRRESVDAGRAMVRILKGSDANRSTKGGYARIVPLGQLYPENLDAVRLRMATPSDSPFLFPGKNGARRDSGYLRRKLSQIVKLHGFNTGIVDTRNMIVWHTLRHTYATRMLEAGVDIYTLKELMGHSSVTTTEIYLHLCDMAKRQAALAHILLANKKTSAG